MGPCPLTTDSLTYHSAPTDTADFGDQTNLCLMQHVDSLFGFEVPSPHPSFSLRRADTALRGLGTELSDD